MSVQPFLTSMIRYFWLVDTYVRKTNAVTVSSEEVFLRFSVTKMFLKISQYSQGNNYLFSTTFQQLSLSNTVAGLLKAWNFIKKRFQHRCFPVNTAKFSRAPILKNIFERLLWSFSSSTSCNRNDLLFPIWTKWKNTMRFWRCPVKKVLVKNVAKFTGKYLCLGLFLIELQVCNFIKAWLPPSKQMCFIWSLTALSKWWKMFFISSWKLLSFSRCLNFCLDF